MGTLKFVNLDYKQEDLIRETIVLLGLCLLESIRIHLGRKGSLSDHGERIALKQLLIETCFPPFRVPSVAQRLPDDSQRLGRRLSPFSPDICVEA